MASRNEQARFRILEAYQRAKEVDPTLTQGQFIRAGAPGMRQDKNDKIALPGKFKNDESAARYFRKIRAGERTGGSMFEEGRRNAQQGSFNVRIRIGKGPKDYISQNMTVFGAESSFDIYAVQHELKTTKRKDVEDMVLYYRNKYGYEEREDVEDLIDELEVDTIQRMRAPSRWNVFI